MGGSRAAGCVTADASIKRSLMDDRTSNVPADRVPAWLLEEAPVDKEMVPGGVVDRSGGLTSSPGAGEHSEAKS